MALKGNIGEWSEIYTFLYLLSKGELPVADDKLNAVPGEFYKIVNILRKEMTTQNCYERCVDRVNVKIKNDVTNAVDEFVFSLNDFANNTQKLLAYLKGKTSRSMQFNDIESFLAELKIYSVKDVGNKRDITITIEDFHSHSLATLGFSIKSMLGSNSTLFNCGSGTNFIYRIVFPENTQFNVDDFNRYTYNIQNKKGKITNRILELENTYNAKICFESIQSSVFCQNLMMIDCGLPRIIADMLLIRFRSEKNYIRDCANELNVMNPFHFNLSLGQPIYEYKVKKFLQDCAMGMTAEKVWSGDYDATGGQIVVKESGEVVCYHIYELNRFQKFLFDSTYFETPSTSEDENNPGHPRQNPSKKYFWGWVYEENGNYYIKLNLQVRMKR